MVYMVYICMCRTSSAHINIWHIYIYIYGVYMHVPHALCTHKHMAYIYIWDIWYVYACVARPLRT